MAVVVVAGVAVTAVVMVTVVVGVDVMLDRGGRLGILNASSPGATVLPDVEVRFEPIPNTD